MITEADLKAAIAECEGSRNPTASTCLKLAAYYTILNQKGGGAYTRPLEQNYSFASEPDIHFGNSEFSRLVQEKSVARCWPIIDELMGVLLVVDPKLYQSIIRKLDSV